MTDAAPQPKLGFGVGIVGHRADRIENSGKVSSSILEVLKAVDQALDAAEMCDFYRNGRQPVRLVSALAEGADRLAASAALEAGFRLDAILPFVASEYRKDFADAQSCAEFDHLLGLANTSLTLDGKSDHRKRAYEAAGLSLLDNCDLLLAVWDGGPGRGRGGTREVVEEAARRAKPIIVVSPDGASVKIRSGGANSGPMRLDDLPELDLVSLPGLIAAAVCLEGGYPRLSGWLDLAQPPPDPAIHFAYPLLIRLVGAGRRPTAGSIASGTEPAHAGSLGRAFEWWDTAAVRAAQAFRSAVIVNFALAALAVVLAATSLLVGHLKWAFVLAEVVTILSLLANNWAAGRNRWQERWLESREVAELLRVISLLRIVGIGRGISNPSEGGPSGWYAGAYARVSPLESIDLSDPATAAVPLLAELRSQAAWNEATAVRLRLASHRIERFGEALFLAVLVAALGWLGLNLARPDVAYDLRYVLTAITAGLPALATASYGIRIILDFEGIAERSQAIASGLNRLIDGWQAAPHNATTLQDFARRAADIMLGDVAAWRLLAESRRLTIPG